MTLTACFELPTSFILTGMIELYMKGINIPKFGASVSLPSLQLKIPTIPNSLGININIATGCVPSPWDNILLDMKGSSFAAGFGITLPKPKLNLSATLKEVEVDLSFFTHSNINTVVPNYAAAEAKVAKTLSFSSSMGSMMKSDPCTSGEITLAGLLTGIISTDRLIKTPPSITFSDLVPYSSSSSSSGNGIITSDTAYLLTSELSGGNMPISDFTYEWSIVSAPENSDVSYEELYSEPSLSQWNIGTILNFDTVGTYIIMLTFTSSTYESVQITKNLSVEVV
jgi:hypothetical protein